MSMESSFNAVELRELRGGGGRRGVSPTPVSSPWTSTVGCAARGFENASYQQDEDHDHQQQHQQGATVSATSSSSKVNKSKRNFLNVMRQLVESSEVFL